MERHPIPIAAQLPDDGVNVLAYSDVIWWQANYHPDGSDPNDGIGAAQVGAARPNVVRLATETGSLPRLVGAESRTGLTPLACRQSLTEIA
jgi:hypothetical protein